MIIYWDSLEKNAGDPALIPDYIASPYFTSDLYPAAAKKLLALGPSGDLVLPKKLEVSGKVGFGMSGATHEVHLLESGSAISGTDVDISELGFVIHNLENVNGLAVGLGFAQTSEMSNVGAAIIFERTGSQSQGSLHFATKNTSGIGDDISIKMTIDKDGNISIISGNFTIIDGNLTVADNKDIKFDSGAKIERSDGHIVLTPEEDKLVKVAIIRRDYTTNTYKNNTVILAGWGWKIGEDDTQIYLDISFGITFADEPIVVTGFCGSISGSDPTAFSSFSDPGVAGTVVGVINLSHTTTGFRNYWNRSDGATFSSGSRYGVSWIAIGELS